MVCGSECVCGGSCGLVVLWSWFVVGVKGGMVMMYQEGEGEGEGREG